jgi:MFS family permease
LDARATPTGTSAAAEWRAYWYLPLVAALGFSSAGYQTYAIGAFINPLQAAFGWTRAEITSGITIANVSAALFATGIGLVVDRIGPRRVGLIGVPLVAAAFALLATATGTMLNWWLLWCVIAFAALWTQGTVWTSAVVSRFEASRGMAIAITLTGMSITGAVLPPLATLLLQMFGLRGAFVALAVVWTLVLWPPIFFGFRGAQDDRRHRPDHAPAAAALPGLRLADGLRRPAFYKLAAVGCIFSFCTLSMMVHMVPIIIGFGATPMKAASIASLAGFASILGRLASGYLLDRFPAHIVGASTYAMPIVGGVLMLVDGGSTTNQAIACILFGLTMGSETDVITYLVTRHFGLRAFGTIMGTVFGAIALGAAFGPVSAGAVYDHFGSYAPFIMGIIVMMAISALVLLTLKCPPSPEA